MHLNLFAVSTTKSELLTEVDSHIIHGHPLISFIMSKLIQGVAVD